jgi:hypothetical protein
MYGISEDSLNQDNDAELRDSQHRLGIKQIRRKEEGIEMVHTEEVIILELIFISNKANCSAVFILEYVVGYIHI